MFTTKGEYIICAYHRKFSDYFELLKRMQQVEILIRYFECLSHENTPFKFFCDRKTEKRNKAECSPNILN